MPASAEDAVVGVGVSPVGAGVTICSSGHRDYERDRPTIVKEREPDHDKTVIIKKDHDRDSNDKVIIHRDRD